MEYMRKSSEIIILCLVIVASLLATLMAFDRYHPRKMAAARAYVEFAVARVAHHPFRLVWLTPDFAQIEGRSWREDAIDRLSLPYLERFTTDRAILATLDLPHAYSCNWYLRRYLEEYGYPPEQALIRRAKAIYERWCGESDANSRRCQAGRLGRDLI